MHEGGFRVFSDKVGEGIVFFTPGGRAMEPAPPAPELGPSPADRMIARNRDRGVVPHPDALRQRYRGYMDIPWPIEAAAREALDSEPSDDGAA